MIVKTADIIAMMRLVMPDVHWRLLRMGSPLDMSHWTSGLDGTNYDPYYHPGDWMIEFFRKLGIEPTIRQLKAAERMIRKEP